jgi:hypothetical protein
LVASLVGCEGEKGDADLDPPPLANGNGSSATAGETDPPWLSRSALPVLDLGGNVGVGAGDSRRVGDDMEVAGGDAAAETASAIRASKSGGEVADD